MPEYYVWQEYKETMAITIIINMSIPSSAVVEKYTHVLNIQIIAGQEHQCEEVEQHLVQPSNHP